MNPTVTGQRNIVMSVSLSPKPNHEALNLDFLVHSVSHVDEDGSQAVP